MVMRTTIALTLALLGSPGAAAQPAGASVQPIPESVWRRMQGRSWHSHMPCPRRESLALVTVPYRDFSGNQQWGSLIVARSVAADVARAFQEIYESRQFRIARMRLVDEYDGSDDASMEDNNTSGFNCRTVAGTGRLSKHARGLAIDINPVQNPFRDGRETVPRAGSLYDQPHERKPGIIGLIVNGDVVTKAFARIGWSWGGNFRYTKDYQHFAR